MQFLSEVKNHVVGFLDENSTMLLTAGGVVGTVATAVLSARGGFKAAEILAAEKARRAADENNEKGIADPTELISPEDVTLETFDKVKLVGLHFVPPIVTGAATIGAIVVAHRMSSAKIAGLAAAYGLAERNLSEYKEKVTEKLTGPKKQQLEEEISQDRVNRAGNPPNMVILGDDVLCFDEATDRYFHSSMEKIRSAVNKTNAEILNGMGGYADASFFYNELGMKGTKWSDEVGWNTLNLLELKYDTVTSQDGRPCLSIIFENFPRTDFIGKHD